jgi:alpha-L-fucosidase
MKVHLPLLLLLLIVSQSYSQKPIEPTPSNKPSKYQQEQIQRKYGMFIHFGVNTFWNEEWTDGSKPPSSYKPPTIDADQWIQTARMAGMKYVLLVTKHVDGFCLWDSKYTTYDVGSSPNKTNVVAEVAKACKKYGVRMGIYYSLWDRHQNADLNNTSLDKAYNEYIVDQIAEIINIINQYTPPVEIWLDAGWEKKRERWPVKAIYETVKKLAPQCQVGVNWSIGKPDNPDPDSTWLLPTEQKAGYPIRYFPSDFRMGDPYFPANPDPKLFSHNGKLYYMPWETTVTISQKWFYHVQDTVWKSPQELFTLYKKATAQDNLFVLDLPPGPDGKLREKDRQIVFALKKLIDAEKK